MVCLHISSGINVKTKGQLQFCASLLMALYLEDIRLVNGQLTVVINLTRPKNRFSLIQIERNFICYNTIIFQFMGILHQGQPLVLAMIFTYLKIFKEVIVIQGRVIAYLMMIKQILQNKLFLYLIQINQNQLKQKYS